MFTASCVLAAITTLMLMEEQNQEIAFMGGIFVLAALLWVTEALPLFATALLVIGLEIILLANPGNGQGLASLRAIILPFKKSFIPLPTRC